MPTDPPRPTATGPDLYSLTIEEAALRYEHAGHPRTLRTLQRYCARGDLECLRQETPFGERYRITPESVARHIAQIEELSTAASRDRPRPTATDIQPPLLQDETSTSSASGHDAPRQAATDTRYIERLEGENEFLRTQVNAKDIQIKDLTERARETNHLIAGLQKMLTPLLGRPSERDAAGSDPVADRG